MRKGRVSSPLNILEVYHLIDESIEVRDIAGCDDRFYGTAFPQAYYLPDKSLYVVLAQGVSIFYPRKGVIDDSGIQPGPFLGYGFGLSRVIGDEMILVPVYKSSDEINCIYTLNKVAARVWEMFDGKKALGAIKKQVLKEFVTTPQEMEKELKKLLKDLQEIKAIV